MYRFMMDRIKYYNGRQLYVLIAYYVSRYHQNIPLKYDLNKKINF